jgi:hypothetical protein
MDYPSVVAATRTVATIAVFVALVVGSNFALTELPDAKLDGVIVFASTVIFGAGPGAAIAILSELIWSQASPWGPSGSYLLPFLLSGELFYVGAGFVAAKISRRTAAGQADRSLLFGGALVLSTLAWDLWTNFGTALAFYGAGISSAGLLLIEFNPPALLFDAVHEGTNLLLGLLLAPVLADLGMKWTVRHYALPVGGN